MHLTDRDLAIETPKSFSIKDKNGNVIAEGECENPGRVVPLRPSSNDYLTIDEITEMYIITPEGERIDIDY